MPAQTRQDARRALRESRAARRGQPGTRCTLKDAPRPPAGRRDPARRRNTDRGRLRRADYRSSCTFSGGYPRLPERVSQTVHGRMQLPLHRALCQTERFRDLAQFHTLMMPHHQYDSLSLWKSADFCFKDLTDLAAIGALFRSGGFFGGVQHSLFRVITKCRTRIEPRAALVVDTGVHDDSIEPRSELSVLPESVKRPEDFDEHVLGDVLGVMMIARKLIGHAVHHRAVTLDKHLKGGRVPPCRAGDEVRISRHHA